MDLKENIIPYSVNLLTEGDCNINQLVNDLGCLYAKIGEESMFLFDGLEGAYKETTIYYILEIQKQDAYLGAFCELLYRLNTDDYSELVTDVNTEQVKKQFELEFSKALKGNKPRVNTEVVTDPQTYQEGGVPPGIQGINPTNLRRRLAAMASSQQTPVQNPIQAAINNGNTILQSTPPSYKIRKIESLMVTLRIPPEKAKLWAPRLIQAWSFVKASAIFLGSGLPDKVTLIPFVLTVPLPTSYFTHDWEERMIDNIDIATCSKYELNEYKMTIEFYTEAIYSLEEKAASENRRLTPHEKATIDNITDMIKRRQQLHEDFKKYRSKSFLVQVVLKSSITMFRNLINLFLFSWVGGPVVDSFVSLFALGGSALNFVVGGGLSAIFGSSSFIVNLYSGLVTGISTVGKLAWNLPIIPKTVISTAKDLYNFFQGGQAQTTSVSNIASAGVQYASNIVGSAYTGVTDFAQYAQAVGVEGLQAEITNSISNALPAIIEQMRSGDFTFLGNILGTRSIGSLVIAVRNLLIRYSTAILFIFPASTTLSILFMCFLYSLAYNTSIYREKQKVRDDTKKIQTLQRASAMNIDRTKRLTTDPTTWYSDQTVEEKIDKAIKEILARERAALTARTTTAQQPAQPFTSAARTAQQSVRNTSYLDPLTFGFGYFGGKRKTRHRRRHQKKRKISTRRS
jgi:hypothetical protein